MMSLFAGWCIDLLGSEAEGATAVAWHVNAFLDYDEGDDDLDGVRDRLSDWIERNAVEAEDDLAGVIPCIMPLPPMRHSYQ